MTTQPIQSTTDDLIAEIEAAMASATPGYWYQSKGIGVVVDHNDCGVVCETHEDNPVDAVYIAACNPSNVRRLIARIRELEQYKREATQVMNPVLDYARSLNLAKWGESITQALIADHQRLVALEQAQRWRDIGEEMPEEDVRVLVWCDDGSNAWPDTASHHNSFFTDEHHELLPVTHWKPVTPP